MQASEQFIKANDALSNVSEKKKSMVQSNRTTPVARQEQICFALA